jgi:hypothetical protein
MVAVAVFEVSATDVAVTVTTPALEGAVNVTVAHGALHAEKVPALADHVTPWLPVSFVKVAVKPIVCDVTSPPRRGETLTLMVEVVMVIVAIPSFVPSEIDVAVNVTVGSVGAEAGAV